MFGVIEPGNAGAWVLVAVAVAVSDDVSVGKTRMVEGIQSSSVLEDVEGSEEDVVGAT